MTLLSHIDKWGPVFWQSMHTLTFTYPNRPTWVQRRLYKRVLYGIAKTLPCAVCRDDFMRLLRHAPPNMKSRQTFSMDLFKLHNKVNMKLSKPTQASYESIARQYLTSEQYTEMMNVPTGGVSHVQAYILVAIVCCILVIFVCALVHHSK